MALDKLNPFEVIMGLIVCSFTLPQMHEICHKVHLTPSNYYT